MSDISKLENDGRFCFNGRRPLFVLTIVFLVIGYILEIISDAILYDYGFAIGISMFGPIVSALFAIISLVFVSSKDKFGKFMGFFLLGLSIYYSVNFIMNCANDESAGKIVLSFLTPTYLVVTAITTFASKGIRAKKILIMVANIILLVGAIASIITNFELADEIYYELGYAYGLYDACNVAGAAAVFISVAYIFLLLFMSICVKRLPIHVNISGCEQPVSIQQPKNNIVSNNKSDSDKLRDLKRLFEDGIITQEEYDKKRKEIIERM